MASMRGLKGREQLYGEARQALCKSVVLAWLRAGGKDSRAAEKVKRIWKHAENALLRILLERAE